MLPRLYPADADRLPYYRLAALGVSYFIPLVLSVIMWGPSVGGILGSLFYPTVRKLIIVGGLVVQVLRIVRPEQARERTFVFTSTQGEMGLIGLALFFDFALSYINRDAGFAGMLLRAMDWFCVYALFGFRERTVIDGLARVIKTGDPIVRTVPFDAVLGLGTIDLQRMRYGSIVGRTYFVAVFRKDGGAPIRVVGYPTPQDVHATITALAQQTGIPIAPPA